MQRRVLELGILPYFANKITGFSVEESVPEDILWNIYDGPWEWKGTIIRDWQIAYGKFFNRKAGYISLELLPDFLNVRRSMFPLEQHAVERRLYDILLEHESLLSREFKSLAGFGSRREKGDAGFDTLVGRLQMGGRVVIADFEYKYDRQGNRYGWGVALYTTPEALYGRDIINVEDRSPEESFDRLVGRMMKNLPDVPVNLIEKLVSI